MRVTLGAFVILLSGVLSAQDVARAPVADVDPALAVALVRESRVAVVVVLRPADAPRGRAELDRVKDRILGGIPEGAFALGHRFQSLPGLAGRATATGVRALALDPAVARIGIDQPIRGSLAESAQIISAPIMHALGFTGEGTTVAVLDSGIDTDHPDLSDDLAPGAFHFLGGGTNTGPGAEDDNGHGTEVASVITSAGNQAPLGIAPDAKILAIKVLSQNNTGFVSDFAAGIDHVTTNRAMWPDLAGMNLSFATFAGYASCPCDNADASTQLLAGAVQRANTAGIPVFAAAGNGARSAAMPAPACLTGVTAVGATYDRAFTTTITWSSCADQSPAVDSFVCINDRVGNCLDLLAPGAVLALSAMGGGINPAAGGTSFACPHVAAAAAVIRQAIPRLPAADLIAALRNGGKPILDPVTNLSVPRIDLAQTLNVLPRIDALDVARVGTRIRLRLRAPGSSGRGYVAAASLGTRPGIALGNGRTIALRYDVLAIATRSLPAVFDRFIGSLDARGDAIAFVHVPRESSLAGVTFHLAYFTHDTQIRDVSWPLALTVAP